MLEKIRKEKYGMLYFVLSAVVIALAILVIILAAIFKNAVLWLFFVFLGLVLCYLVALLVLEFKKLKERRTEEPAKEPAHEEAPKAEEPKAEEPAEEPKAAEKPEEKPEEGAFEGLGKRRKRIPFEQRLKRAPAEARVHYKEIIEAVNEYKVSDRKSIPGETISYKKERLMFITLAGNTLKVYFALDPKEFEDSTIPLKDASDVKKFESTPSYLKIKSSLAVRRAMRLAKRVFTEHGVPKNKK